MNVSDIVYLKSSEEKLMITWLVGITENKKIPIDVNNAMMMQPTHQIGDIAVKYGTDKKATIPGDCLIDDLSRRTQSIDKELRVGNVVRHKLTECEMTIVWIVGQTQVNRKTININKFYNMQGFEDGDVVCGYFESKEYKTDLFNKGEIEKIYE